MSARMCPAWTVLAGLVVFQLAAPRADAQGLGGIRNPFNNKPIGEQIGDGRGGIKILPRGGSGGDQGSQIAVISPPSIDPDTGAVFGGTTSGGGRGNRVANATLYKAQDGRWWWRSDYRDYYTGSTSPVPASNRIQQIKQGEERAENDRRQREQQQRAAREQQQRAAREQQQREQQQRAAREQQQRAAREQQQRRDEQQRAAWEQQREQQQRAAWEQQQQQREIEERQAFNLNRAQEEQRRREQENLQSDPTRRNPQNVLPGGGQNREMFATNLGVYYEAIPYANGTFGARLTRDAAPGTPASALQLERGDVIFALDGARFQTPEDVLNHVEQTSVDFINVRTNGRQGGMIFIPNSR